jgi:hypothetical protein
MAGDLAAGICHQQGAALAIAHRPDQCPPPGVFLPSPKRNDEPDAGLHVAPGTQAG